MTNPNERDVPEMKPLTEEELRAAYAEARANFTAADLQLYTEVDEEWISAEQLLAELEEIHRQAEAERNGR